MSRGRSERKPQRGGFQVDHYARRGDPFQQMHQIMRSFGGGFGGFGNDFFGGGLMRDPFEEMMQFSNAHKGLHGSGKQGSYVCQTFVSSSSVGADGKIKQESFFENSAGQNKNGQTISQKQQAYKNNDGIKRIAEERMLNDQGRKVIKEKRGNQEVQETNHYYNMDEEDVGRFDQNWRGVNQNMKFLENHHKMMQGLPYREQPQLGLGYQPQREEARNYRQPVQQEYRQPLQQESRNYRQPAQEYRPVQQEYRQPVQQQYRQPLQQQIRGPGSRGQQISRSNYSQKGSNKGASRGQH